MAGSPQRPGIREELYLHRTAPFYSFDPGHCGLHQLLMFVLPDRIFVRPQLLTLAPNVLVVRFGNTGKSTEFHPYCQLPYMRLQAKHYSPMVQLRRSGISPTAPRCQGRCSKSLSAYEYHTSYYM